jgi:pyruvate,water dikinase
MVPAVVSGVAFTINPVTGADEVVVNAATGLGEALVSGQVDPDEFTLRKADASVVSVRRGRGDGSVDHALSSEQLTELGRLLIRIERLYGAPQDVEWCHDGRQFWIVQSRPVTTHPTHATHPTPPDPEWTRANLAEVLPDQTSPQVLTAYDEMLNKGQRQFMGRLLAPDEQLGPMFKPFHGRMYMNLSQMRRVVALGNAPAADMLRSLGHPEAIHPEDEIPRRAPIVEFLKCLPDFIRIASYDVRAASLVRKHEANTHAIIEQLTAIDPRTMSDQRICDMFRWWLDSAPDAIQVVFVMSGTVFRETAIRKACNAVGFRYERLVYPQLAAGERSVSTRQATELIVLADVARHDDPAREYLLRDDGSFRNYRASLAGTTFLKRFDRFLDDFGHRGRYESDWSIPRLHENPAPALFAIQQHLHAPPVDLKAVVDRQNADAANAWREFEARLSPWQRWTLLPRIKSMLARLKKQYVWREQIRSDLTRVLRYARGYHLALADRFVERGWIDSRDDYFLIKLEEIDAALTSADAASGLRAIAARRRAELEAEQQLRMPMLMRESQLAALLGQQASAAPVGAERLTGLCVSPGSVDAEVVVMRDPAEFASMKRGAILVAPATDPSWTPLFTLATGVIVEVGGMLSHASTIAREYGLPALANVKDATRILRTGDRVRLDASRGTVTRI